MSDLTPDEPHAPAANDASHCGLDALKHGIPTCKECGHSLYVVKGAALVHHECPVTMERGE